MLLIINSNPALQKIYFVDGFKKNRVNRVSKMLTMAGGKGINTARALKCMGTDDYVLMTYAPKSFHSTLVRDLGEHHQSAVIETGRALRTCTTLIDGDNVTEITEPNVAISKDAKEAFRNQYENLIPNAKMLLISGSVIAGEDEDLYYQLIKLANMFKIPVMLDFSGIEILKTLRAKIDFLKINNEEFKQIGKLLKVKKAPEIVYCLQYQYKVKNIILTDKDKDVTVYAENNDKFTVSVPAVETLNTTGCGDAFSAGFIYEYLDSKDIRAAVKRGVAVSTASAVTMEMSVFDKSYADKLYMDINSCNQESLFLD